VIILSLDNIFGGTSVAEEEIVTIPETQWEDAGTKRGGGSMTLYVGESGTGKSVTALTAYKYNSKYSNEWKDEFPLSYKLLKKGLVPEIETIYSIDTECIHQDRLFNPIYSYLYKIFKPIIGKGVIKVKEIFGESAKPNELRDPLKSLEQLIGAVKSLRSLASENTLVVVDSLSEYKKDLQDDFRYNIMGMEGPQRTQQQKNLDEDEKKYAAIQQKFYSERNKRWKGFMIGMRDLRGKKILCSKANQKWVESRDPEIRGYQEGKENIYPDILKGSEHWFEMGFMFWRDFKEVYSEELKKTYKVTQQRTCEFIPEYTKVRYTSPIFMLHDDAVDTLASGIKPDPFNYLRIMERIAGPILAEVD